MIMNHLISYFYTLYHRYAHRLDWKLIVVFLAGVMLYPLIDGVIAPFVRLLTPLTIIYLYIVFAYLVINHVPEVREVNRYLGIVTVPYLKLFVHFGTFWGPFYACAVLLIAHRILELAL